MARDFLSALFLVLAVALAGAGARGEALDTATCGQIKGEQVRMEQSGVRANMEKGPQWAKANLAADKLDQIRRLMDLDEQLIFRCSSRNLVELPPEADADPAPAKADEEGKDPPKTDAPGAQAKPGAPKAAPPAKTPAAKPGPKEAAKPAPKEAAKSPPATPKAATATPKAAPAPKQEPAKNAAPPADKAAAAKPKPKAKVEDAYKAPPANPNVDPFANQPARQ